MLLEFDGVSHRYGGPGSPDVLRDIGLSVPEGQLLSIVGPSGCGKSTLLRCAAGLLTPYAGEVRLGGRAVTGVPDRLGVVFQDYARSLFPWLSVRDNVAVPLLRTGTGRAARRAEAARMLELVGLPEVARRYPWQLSGGMQQRVALARALVCRPELLLMDEPFGSLDAQAREDLEDLLLRVHRAEGATILLVTHDIDESVYVGDRVAVLSPGPGRVRADLEVPLPPDRDQITTRAHPSFVELRAEVGRAVRAAAPRDGDGPRGDASGDGARGDAGAPGGGGPLSARSAPD
ncbi:ABC transporter ATP-binding protein [Streptomyces sp. ODS28]|uniref:ABC transporter ATP-binding protein n=1 Tax=Streptomyces sp. ODS28 TaxID=3136688 RepID=UPI0031EABFAB